MPEHDSQRVELMGRSLLVSLLLRDDLEVARPERDRGIDLIAYIDLDETGGRFLACPIQMKAYTGSAFTLRARYRLFPGLLLAYLWDVAEPERLVTFCLTYQEAERVASVMKWTATDSWLKDGIYTTTSPSDHLRDLLEPYRMTPGRWVAKVREVATDRGLTGSL